MRGPTRGSMANHSSSVPEPNPKIALMSCPHLPPPLGLYLCWGGGLQQSGGGGLGVADGLLAFFSPPLLRMVCTLWDGVGCRRADGHPQLPVSAQMATPTPISVPCSGYGGTSTCNWGFQTW